MCACVRASRLYSQYGLTCPPVPCTAFWLESAFGVVALAVRRNSFWTVLKTKQVASTDARDNLRNQEFEFFHPTFRMRAVRGVRRVAPLFPFYLLARVDEWRQDWRRLSSTKGVTNILMDGEQPGRVRDHVVDEIRRLTEDTVDGYYHDAEHDAPKFTRDQAVVGTRGLFAEKYGVFRGLAGNRRDRVRVLFNILGREAEFEVGADDLVAVAA